MESLNEVFDCGMRSRLVNVYDGMDVTNCFLGAIQDVEEYFSKNSLYYLQSDEGIGDLIDYGRTLYCQFGDEIEEFVLDQLHAIPNSVYLGISAYKKHISDKDDCLDKEVEKELDLVVDTLTDSFYDIVSLDMLDCHIDFSDEDGRESQRDHAKDIMHDLIVHEDVHPMIIRFHTQESMSYAVLVVHDGHLKQLSEKTLIKDGFGYNFVSPSFDRIHVLEGLDSVEVESNTSLRDIVWSRMDESGEISDLAAVLAMCRAHYEQNLEYYENSEEGIEDLVDFCMIYHSHILDSEAERKLKLHDRSLLDLYEIAERVTVKHADQMYRTMSESNRSEIDAIHHAFMDEAYDQNQLCIYTENQTYLMFYDDLSEEEKEHLSVLCKTYLVEQLLVAVSPLCVLMHQNGNHQAIRYFSILNGHYVMVDLKEVRKTGVEEKIVDTPIDDEFTIPGLMTTHLEKVVENAKYAQMIG